MSGIRTFIAIGLGNEISQDLERYIEGLQQLVEGVRWVAVQNIHLTLRFLGSLDEGGVLRVRRAVLAGAEGTLPFTLRPGSLGGFPDLRRPRVLYINLEGDLETLKRLQSRIEDELFRSDFSKQDKPFSPHITIGRVRRGRRALWNAPTIPIQSTSEMLVREILILKSDLRPEGPVYTPLARTVLG